MQESVAEEIIIPDDFVRELAPWINFNTLFLLELVKKNYRNGMLWQYLEDFDASQLTATVQRLAKRFTKLKKRPIDYPQLIRSIATRIGPHLRRVRNFTIDEASFNAAWPLAAKIAPQLRSLAITTPVPMSLDLTREVYSQLIMRLSPEKIKILYIQHFSTSLLPEEIFPEFSRAIQRLGGGASSLEALQFATLANYSDEETQQLIDIISNANLRHLQYIDVNVPEATSAQLQQLTNPSRNCLKQVYIAPSPWEVSHSQKLPFWSRVLNIDLDMDLPDEEELNLGLVDDFDYDAQCIAQLGVPLCGLRQKHVGVTKKFWEEYIENKIFGAKRASRPVRLGTPQSERLLQACYPDDREEMIPDRAFALLSLSKLLQHYAHVDILDKVEWFSEKVEKLYRDATQRWVVLVPAVVLLLFNLIDKPEKLFLSAKTGRNLRDDARAMLHEWIVNEPRIITLFPVLSSLTSFSFGSRAAFEGDDAQWAATLVSRSWDQHDFVTGTPLIFSFIDNPHLLTSLVRSGRVDWLLQNGSGQSLLELAFAGGSTNSWVVVMGKTWPNFLTEPIVRHFRDRTLLPRLGEFVSLVESCHAAALALEDRNLSLDICTILWRDILENETSIDRIKADVLGMLRAFDVFAQLLIDFCVDFKTPECKCILTMAQMRDLLLAEVSGLREVVNQQRSN